MESEPIYVVGTRDGRTGRMDEATQAAMRSHFERLGTRTAPEPGHLLVNGRELPMRGRASDLVWFDFATLCDTPRSTADFSELANEFNTVLLSGIPVLDADQDDQARRLVNLVDEFYDRARQARRLGGRPRSTSCTAASGSPSSSSGRRAG